MEIQQNSAQPEGDSQQGKAENEKANYTSLASDGPVSTDEAKGKSNLQNTEPYEDDEDEIGGDLAGNASGNEETED